MASNLTAGLQQFGEVANPTGLAGSITQDPFSPVEAGTNSIKSKYTTTPSSGSNIDDQTAPAAAPASPVQQRKVNTDG